MTSPSAGARLRSAWKQETPLQIVGVINAYAALLARDAGFQALYLSGAGVANASLGLPDLGLLTLQDMFLDASRITSACPLPLLVDADTGWGSLLLLERGLRELERIGVAAIQLEDQVTAKRCGHRPNKRLVPKGTMVDRVRAACQARRDDAFVVVARTDAHAVEGFTAAVDRAGAYVDAGADVLFAEAFPTLDEFASFTRQVRVPVLANLTEFGKTPLYSLDQMRQAGVAIVLYPLSAFRAMSRSAMDVYETIRRQGGQSDCLDRMQTRDELYRILEYHRFEGRVDASADEPT